MRIPPIEKPRNLLVRLAYRMSKRQFGKVMSSLKVAYARNPWLLFFAQIILSTSKKLHLSESDHRLINLYVATLNNCSFCEDLNLYLAAKQQLEHQKTLELLQFRQSPNFSEREKAMLNYVDEITLTKSASEETFNQLKNYFSDQCIVEITWLCAIENYYNIMSKPLGIKSDEFASGRLRASLSEA